MFCFIEWFWNYFLSFMWCPFINFGYVLEESYNGYWIKTWRNGRKNNRKCVEYIQEGDWWPGNEMYRCSLFFLFSHLMATVLSHTCLHVSAEHMTDIADRRYRECAVGEQRHQEQMSNRSQEEPVACLSREEEKWWGYEGSNHSLRHCEQDVGCPCILLHLWRSHCTNTEVSSA